MDDCILYSKKLLVYRLLSRRRKICMALQQWGALFAARCFWLS
jgi:hypothetical protein